MSMAAAHILLILKVSSIIFNGGITKLQAIGRGMKSLRLWKNVTVLNVVANDLINHHLPLLSAELTL